MSWKNCNMSIVCTLTTNSMQTKAKSKQTGTYWKLESKTGVEIQMSSCSQNNFEKEKKLERLLVRTTTWKNVKVKETGNK